MNDPEILFSAFKAFCAFCLCASSIYLLNDLWDKKSDQAHPTKRRRAIAAGLINQTTALFLSLLCFSLSAVLCLFLPKAFGLVIAGYFMAALVYFVFLKTKIMIDVVFLALLYTLRIWGGVVASGVPESVWLFIFSIFIFLSLALVKRVSELQRRLKTSKDLPHNGRGYFPNDLPILNIIGCGSGLIAILVLCLYTNSNSVYHLYSAPELLLAVAPVLCYWLGRLWIKAHRGEVDEDPVAFALSDKASYFCFALLSAILLSAKFILL